MTTSVEIKHKWWVATLIVLNVFIFLGVQFFSYISMSDVFGNDDIFRSDQRNLSDKYYIEITPASWAFSIWGLIYIWTAIWLIYACTLICRKTPQGYLYVTPPIIPVPVYPIIAVNLLMNIAWLVTFDREMMVVAGIILLALAISLYICIGLVMYSAHTAAKYLIFYGKKIELWCLRILVHNGLALYVGWCTLAKLLNVTIVVVYVFGVNVQIGSTISLGILAGELVVFFILEQFVFEKELRYILAHYVTIIWGLVGSFIKNYHVVHRRNAYMIAALFGAACFIYILKVVRTLFMHFRRPLYEDDKKQLFENELV